MKRVGPSIAKSKQTPLVETRLRPLVRCSDYRWRELFEAADVISEGALRDDERGSTYYGTTSILLCAKGQGAGVDEQERASLATIFAVDPHARLRAVRIACLEAQLRANTNIDSIRAEVTYSSDSRGLRIMIDVEARVIMETSSQRVLVGNGARRKR